MPEKTSGHACVVCRGKIIEVTESEFDARTGPLIIGPGSVQQFQEKTSYHCGQCGIEYRFLPKWSPPPPKYGPLKYGGKQ